MAEDRIDCQLDKIVAADTRALRAETGADALVAAYATIISRELADALEATAGRQPQSTQIDSDDMLINQLSVGAASISLILREGENPSLEAVVKAPTMQAARLSRLVAGIRDQLLPPAEGKGG